MRRFRIAVMMAISCGAILLFAGVVPAAEPDHPIITEVYTDPNGNNDGPVGRDPTNPHQEFIEIYLPPLSALNPALDKDSLELTFYEAEGDSSSSGLGLINYRFDLPPFDLDSSNGLTPGAIERPASGVVVLGWLDYLGDPPTDLRGTPATRVGLINGEITAPPSDFVFIAINGQHFGGTTNFKTVLAESLIDVPNETRSGIIQNGSGAYLLVDRESVGYVELFDDKHVPAGESADPSLPSGTVLMTSALLDGFAGNDDLAFDVVAQPYETPTGEDIDLETVLPLDGAFSLLVPQVPERDPRPTEGTGNGYRRVFVDVAKTTETLDADDPVADAQNAYRRVRNIGPFYPTPGKSPSTTSAPELSVAVDTELLFEVLHDTVGRPGLLSANIGGSFGIDVSASLGGSSDPLVAAFAPGDAAMGVLGQSFAFPTVVVSPGASVSHGSAATSSVTITAVNSTPGDPSVLNASHVGTMTATVLRPTTGLDHLGQPLQATVFVAAQSIIVDPVVTNEFLGTDLASYLTTELDQQARDTWGQGQDLIDPGTDISDPLVIEPLIHELPDEEGEYINTPGAPGMPDLLTTVLTSAEMLSGAITYNESFDGNQENVQALRINTPDTLTVGGSFSPSEHLYFADAIGTSGDVRSGLSNATTPRTFEMALVDSNVTFFGDIETGATDDFGLVIEVEDTEAGSPVVDGELVFLSFTGGLQGADIDPRYGLDGNVVASVIYLDLDNLHDVLGIRSIEAITVVDGSGSGEVDLIEVFSLNLAPSAPFPDLDEDGDVDANDYGIFEGCASGPEVPRTQTDTCRRADFDKDNDVDQCDFGEFQRCYSGENIPAAAGCSN